LTVFAPIVRPLFVFLTLAMIVLAFFQVVGRLLFNVLDDLEVGINQWLSPQQILISGLEGDWHRINPVVRIHSISLPAGTLTGVHAEIDWLESLIRNKLVLHHLSLEEGRLLLARTEGGWRLLGTAGGGEFDPFPTLYHSDQIDLKLRLGFVNESGEAQASDDLAFSYRATNRAGRHRHRLTIENQGCLADCRVQFALDASEAVPLLRERELQASLTGGNLRIPEPLNGGGGGRFSRAAASWWQSGDLSGGEGRLEIADVVIDDDRVGGEFTVSSRGEGEIHHIVLNDFKVHRADVSWGLPPFWFTFERGEAESLLTGWTERIEAGPGFRFFSALVPSQTAAFRWLNALNASATALNVHGYLRVPSLDGGFLATLQDISLDGYNGAPRIRGAAGELLGANRALELKINADQVDLQFPDMFHQRWQMDHLSGRLQAYVSLDYFALRGTHIKAQLGDTQASAGFALSRPREQRYRERLSILINVDETTVARGKAYIPYQLPSGLPEWLEDGPRSGRLTDVTFAYQGQIHTRPFELGRRVALSGRIEDGHIQYHPSWPAVRDLSGFITVGGRDVRIDVARGLSFEQTDLSGSRIHLADNASVANIDLHSTTTVDEALAFIRGTPLKDWMTFVTPDWAGSGPLRMAGQLKVPLKQKGEHVGEVNPSDELEVDLDIELLSSDLDLPGYGVALGVLNGQLHYTYPYQLQGDGVTGRIFDRPAVFGATSDEDTVIFHVDGQAPYEDVLTLLDVRDPGIIHGGFDFLADLHIELGDGVSRLSLVSDMTGLELDLPGELAKAADEIVPAEFTLQFLDAYQSARFRYGPAQGWMHVNEVLLRGAVGFDAPPPLVDGELDALILGGRIEGFSLEELIPDAGGEGTGSSLSLALPVRLERLLARQIDVSGVLFNDVILEGEIAAGPSLNLDLALTSADITGSLAIADGAPMLLDLEILRLPEQAGQPEDAVPAADPLTVEVIKELVDVDVSVDRFLVGETDYGAWSFQLRPEPGGVALNGLEASLRGVKISADRLFWDGEKDRSYFQGILSAGDLAAVLPQWGYAASVSTERAVMTADLNWLGSPAAVDLTRLIGTAAFEAENGRFLEVTQGADAMKIFSLVNFSTIAKRLNFDFSDVVGEGVSFDSMTATTEFNEGTMQFLEPMAVNGSGSSFRIGGTVGLVDGNLDNEMIVTLPVTKGLPWYAAYIALANPLAGLGVLVGERVLRKPLEQFSSAKYEIGGTLEEPELKFVGVWDTTMDQPHVSIEQQLETDTPPTDSGGESAQPPSESGGRSGEEAEAIQNTGSTNQAPV
jgi:uncharacterized protein YhdP